VSGCAAREGFITIRCGGCGEPVQAPLGPDFWHPASAGVIESRHGVHCRCGHVTGAIGLNDILSDLSWALGGPVPGPDPVTLEEMPPWPGGARGGS
jgi:hypothetical protein